MFNDRLKSDKTTPKSVKPVDVRVYVYTGKQGFFRIPESWCRECDLFVRAVDEAVDRTDVEVDMRVIPWWTHILGALRFGGWHPPVLVVDGTRIAQGYDVPAPARVVEAIESAHEARTAKARAGGAPA